MMSGAVGGAARRMRVCGIERVGIGGRSGWAAAMAAMLATAAVMPSTRINPTSCHHGLKSSIRHGRPALAEPWAAA